jgi:hypothetical protein
MTETFLDKLARIVGIITLFLALGVAFSQFDHWFVKKLGQRKRPQITEATWSRGSELDSPPMVHIALDKSTKNGGTR